MIALVEDRRTVNKDRIEVFFTTDKPLGGTNTHIQLTLSYDKGGFSWSDPSRVVERGYYVSVMPVEVGGGFIKMTAFTGYRDLLLKTKRFSAKTFEGLLDDAIKRGKEMIQIKEEEIKSAA